MVDQSWINVLNYAVDAANKICSYDYYEAYLPVGSLGLLNTHVGLIKGQQVTGIPDNAWPPIFADRVKSGNLSAITREEYDSWRSMYGCAPAKKISGSGPGGIGTMTWVAAGVAVVGVVIVALTRGRKTGRKR